MSSAPRGQAVYVIATTPEGTTGALREAQRTADRARIVLLVPVALADSRTTREFASVIDAHAALARAAGVPATPYVCVCRRPQDVAAWFQVGRSTIVVGGERAAWPLQSEQERLVRALRREGHFVQFVATPPTELNGTSHDVA